MPSREGTNEAGCRLRVETLRDPARVVEFVDHQRRGWTQLTMSSPASRECGHGATFDWHGRSRSHDSVALEEASGRPARLSRAPIAAC